jgi:hypothetical protein
MVPSQGSSSHDLSLCLLGVEEEREEQEKGERDHSL